MWNVTYVAKFKKKVIKLQEFEPDTCYWHIKLLFKSRMTGDSCLNKFYFNLDVNIGPLKYEFRKNVKFV